MIYPVIKNFFRLLQVMLKSRFFYAVGIIVWLFWYVAH
jgi:hypothetical protein